MGSQSYKCCICFTRRYRWSEAEPPADVKALFSAYADAGGGSQMTADGLRRFLVESQDYSGGGGGDAAERILERVRLLRHPHLGKLARQSGLNVEDFHQFLFSVELNPPIRSEVHQDMSAPLSHYYIYTGHNSYLTGNQLSSDCSDAPIIKALQRGVRVIELDMWPNSTKDNIDILHGRTLTSPVELIRCLKSIKQYAFSVSHYPVIITLEDHLTPDLQAKVAEMVTETFGNLLYYPESESESCQDLPSPEFLKNRIIISTKPPKKYPEAKSGKDHNGETPTVGKSKEEDAWGKEVPDLHAEYKFADENKDGSDDEDEDNDDDHKVSHDVPTEYKRIITIRSGKPKGAITEALKVEPDKVRRLSLSEQQLANAAQSHSAHLVRFTQRNILRIYPKGTRVDSSNYNPYIGWIHGAQMVAFNMQGYGRSLWLMHGFYKANGGCGFVKKPDFLIKTGSNNEVFYPNANLPVKKTLKVKVYMGSGWLEDFKQTYFDVYSPPDFYTRVGIAGVPADSIMKKTKAVEDNWTPVWNEEFIFRLTVPELAVLRIEVHEYDVSEKDDFAGQTCLPVSELRPGIRAVALHDRKGTSYKNVKLLVRFEFV